MNESVVLMVLGRQRVGKTSFLNTITQYLRERGSEFEIWDGDRQNMSYNLSLFHRDALRPVSSAPEEVKRWLEERFISLPEHGRSAVLDVGGGDTPLARLVEELPVAEMLESVGVRVVLVHVVGPETADLDYLEHYSSNDLFVSQHTLVVTNGGLVLSGRSSKAAFEPLMKHRAIRRVLSNSGQVVEFPRLACMSEVTDRGLTFKEVLAEVNPPLGMFDTARVRKWWAKDLPVMFSEIPADWLPAIKEDESFDAAE
ncbi:hypothetical protein CCR94_00985 [Rhodoblastus sphagnicola]|uniref:CobQ/CobB/MinD/ParA nucleotide binding domain-containing protein n=1 Tax=Rhodoblastus sphagnicola TaxID=333368 RepID=A0A2S6NGG4_9HYPH|nr:hypothetical protein [Rhodoblastus sphagnicola]MBB4200890.1 hypothetical protein [Rhodoblastus sphagnicola]PPQ33659.1 hypothetical protein CCR94_00985 [Rhodoblastus sphagnicola]